LIQKYGDIQQILCVEAQNDFVQRESHDDIKLHDRQLTSSRNGLEKNVVSSLQNSLTWSNHDDRNHLMPNTLLHNDISYRPSFVVVDVIRGFLSEQGRLTMTSIVIRLVCTSMAFDTNEKFVPHRNMCMDSSRSIRTIGGIDCSCEDLWSQLFRTIYSFCRNEISILSRRVI
jgi:hypothetical protein